MELRGSCWSFVRGRAMMLLALLLLGQPARVRSIDSVPGALYKLLRQLTPVEKGCKASSGTKIASSAPALRADPVFCETLLPKMRQCVLYSFGVGRTGWDLDKALASDGRCRVKSFDPSCCGGFHSIPYLAASASHDFVPLVLAPSDGLVGSSPATGNITAAGLTLKSLMAGFGDSQRSMVTQRGGGLSGRWPLPRQLEPAYSDVADSTPFYHRRQARCPAAERLEPIRVEGARPRPNPNLHPNLSAPPSPSP